MPWMGSQFLLGSHFPFFLFPILIVWSLFWKGISLWHAAKREEKGWFIVFLILNTAGIVELIYLVFVVKFFSQKKSSPARKKSR